MLEKNLHVLAPRMTRLLSIASTILITLSRSLTAGAYLDSATVSGAAVPAARAGVSPAKDNAGGTPGAAGETPAPLWAPILVVRSRCARSGPHFTSLIAISMGAEQFDGFFQLGVPFRQPVVR